MQVRDLLERMSRLESVGGDDLRTWLEHVRGKETATWLMVAIAYDEGVDVGDLASWYEFDHDEIEAWIDEIESDSLVVALAEKEGVDFEEIAGWYGLTTSTIEDWFESLETESIDRAVDIIERYSQRHSQPLVSPKSSRVKYLNYEVIEEHGWLIEDDDLFEKASEAGLDPKDYGRLLVEPGETILEAVENRGMSWPYACRGGACANCAVLVKEGDIAMPGDHVLSDTQVHAMNARLTCVGVPVTDEVKLVMNVQHLDQFEDLRLPSPLREASL